VTERRIEYLPLDEVNPHPRNPRTHESLADVEASVGLDGFIEPIVRDERTQLLVAGHGRTLVLTAKRDAGEDPPDGVVLDARGRWLVPVVVGWASADDAAATRARISLNRTAETGGWDDALLLEQLDELARTPTGLEGSGFTDEAMASLRRLIEASGGAVDTLAEWTAAGMPDFESSNLEGAYRTRVHFRTEADADAFFKMIGRPKISYFWWPEDDGHIGMDTKRQFVLAEGETGEGA
jgi:hypothetical protein